MKSKYKLFECYGIELEYMLVHKKDLTPAHFTDELIIEKNGEITDELENGVISWSNELVLHVVELKTTQPVPKLEGLSHAFHENIQEINAMLDSKGMMLLPTAMHPSLDPYKDLKLWPHHRNEIYEKYNEIFNCKGHGWGNLQSMHINLPFANDEEFKELHAAIRILLPIIPAMSASSPIYENKLGLALDNRLVFYEANQKKVPAITGLVIPEAVETKKEYEEKILQPMYEAIAPYDPEKILQEEWLNSRGAITRFDRNAIEIRIIDLQECPKADIALAEFVVASLKYIIQQKDKRPYISEADLHDIFTHAVAQGLEAEVDNDLYKRFFGLGGLELVSIKTIWKKLLLEVDLSKESKAVVNAILTYGNLSQRIVQAVGDSPTEDRIKSVYHDLARSLANNNIFIP